MKILILGGTGEVGHMLCKNLSSSHQVFTTLRSKNNLNRVNFYSKILPKSNCITLDDIKNEKKLKNVINKINPDLIINCIAVIKHRESCVDGNLEAEYINSIFPHFLKNECELRSIKLIHLSTDCVFSGDRGYYSELELKLLNIKRILRILFFGNHLKIMNRIGAVPGAMVDQDGILNVPL